MTFRSYYWYHPRQCNLHFCNSACNTTCYTACNKKQCGTLYSESTGHNIACNIAYDTASGIMTYVSTTRLCSSWYWISQFVEFFFSAAFIAKVVEFMRGFTRIYWTTSAHSVVTALFAYPSCETCVDQISFKKNSYIGLTCPLILIAHVLRSEKPQLSVHETTSKGRSHACRTKKLKDICRWTNQSITNPKVNEH